jgi:hypothetical protein
MSGITARGTILTGGVLGAQETRQLLPFTGIALGIFAALALGLVLTGLAVRLLGGRGR